MSTNKRAPAAAATIRGDHPFIQAFKRRRELEALALEPPPAKAQEPAQTPKNTGGRPRTTDAVMAEYESRRKSGRCLPTIEAEAKYLEDWRPPGKKKAKGYKAPAWRTIARRISEAMRTVGIRTGK